MSASHAGERGPRRRGPLDLAEDRPRRVRAAMRRASAALRSRRRGAGGARRRLQRAAQQLFGQARRHSRAGAGARGAGRRLSRRRPPRAARDSGLVRARFRRDVRRVERSAIDGCGIPAFALPLRAAARGFARFATLEGLDDADARRSRARPRRGRRAAVRTSAGTERFDTALIAATGGAVVAKGGAEGVHCERCGTSARGSSSRSSTAAQRAVAPAVVALLRAARRARRCGRRSGSRRSQRAGDRKRRGTHGGTRSRSAGFHRRVTNRPDLAASPRSRSRTRDRIFPPAADLRSGLFAGHFARSGSSRFRTLPIAQYPQHRAADGDGDGVVHRRERRRRSSRR